MSCAIRTNRLQRLITHRLNVLDGEYESPMLTVIMGLWGRYLCEGFSEELCEAMAIALGKGEDETREAALEGDESSMNLFAGYVWLHAEMSLLIPRGMNEGNKCWPVGSC